VTITAPVPPDIDPPCRADPELFFTQPDDAGNPERTLARIRKAKAVCARCPFRDPCLAYAITHAVVGTWGGTTWPERQAFRKKNGLVALSLATGMAQQAGAA
jgi:WhiB family redox-sensing transcriptional regulator